MSRPNVTVGAARQRGFTLIEVVVALVVSGVVLLAARALLTGVADGADRLARASRAADQDANGERLLRTLFARLDVATDSARTFTGDERRARFTTWCDVPAGWTERCEAAVVFDSLGGRPALVAVLSTGEVVALRQGFAAGELRYLADAAGGGRWFRDWGRALTAPVAVGLVIDGDTVIVRIGERG